MSTTSRHDPLRNFQFRVKLLHGAGTNEYVAGVQKVSGLNLSVGASETWSGGNSMHRYANPDKVTWDPITLEQGLALDQCLAEWAEAVLKFVETAEMPESRETLDSSESRDNPDSSPTPYPLKRNLAIDVWDPHRAVADGSGERSGTVRRFLIFNAWISRYQALPQLDAMGNEVALISVELVHEGWRAARDDELPGDIVSFPSTGTTAGASAEENP